MAEDQISEIIQEVRVPMDKLFEELKCTSDGLTRDEHYKRIRMFKRNILAEEKESTIKKLQRLMWNPIAWMMQISILLAIGLMLKEPRDWQIFVGSVILFIISIIISVIEENIACNAAEALMVGLGPKTQVRRGGRWARDEAFSLVPGDVIQVRAGDIIPADARLFNEVELVEIDESALFPDFMPVKKNYGDVVFSGSTCMQGEFEAVVIATGGDTLFGQMVDLVDSTNHVRHFQFHEVLRGVINFCMYAIAIGMMVELLVMSLIQHRIYTVVIDNLLVLLLGGSPIVMPTVLSITMTVGSQRLSKQGAFVKRMSVIEDLARMDVLYCNETETLISNTDTRHIKVYNGATAKLALQLEASASMVQDQDAIDQLEANTNSFENQYEIVMKLQEGNHICGMLGDGVNDEWALRKADIGFALIGTNDAARCASDVVLSRLTKPSLDVIIDAVLTSRAILQKMKIYTFYSFSITVHIVLAFMLIALIWKFDFSPFMVLIIVIQNNGTILTIPKDKAKASTHPDSWKLREIFATGIVQGTFMAVTTIIFFLIAHGTHFFSEIFKVRSISNNELAAALYLQVSIASQVLILVTRSFCLLARPGIYIMASSLVAQAVATLIAVYASWGFARTKGIWWGWAGVIWLYSAACCVLFIILKLVIHKMSGKT